MNNLYFIRGDLQGIYHTIIIQEQMLREISDWDRLAIYMGTKEICDQI
jgi:hypothetical protein